MISRINLDQLIDISLGTTIGLGSLSTIKYFSYRHQNSVNCQKPCSSRTPAVPQTCDQYSKICPVAKCVRTGVELTLGYGLVSSGLLLYRGFSRY